MADAESSQIQEPIEDEAMVEHLDVSYGPHELHKIDFFQSVRAASMTPAPPLLVFIHGGAWRTGSRKDHADMARRLVNLRGGNLTVALVDYRLTTQKPLDPSWSKASTQPVQYENRHPAHLNDVFAALRFLLLPAKGSAQGDASGNEAKQGDDQEPPQSKKAKHENGVAKTPAQKYSFDSERVIMMGHSVGAWMAATTLLNSRTTRDNGAVVIPPLCDDEEELKELTRKIYVWILADGIYTLPSLLSEYPGYRDFVAQAFPLEDRQYGTESEQLEQVSLTAWRPYSDDYYCGGDGPHVWLMHSSDDELLSTQQTTQMFSYLGTAMKGPQPNLSMYTPKWGKHDEMLTNNDFLEIVAEEIIGNEVKPRSGRPTFESDDSEEEGDDVPAA